MEISGKVNVIPTLLGGCQAIYIFREVPVKKTPCIIYYLMSSSWKLRICNLNLGGAVDVAFSGPGTHERFAAAPQESAASATWVPPYIRVIQAPV